MSFLSLFKLLRFHKKALAIAILFMIVESLVSLSIPYFIGQFSGTILNGENVFGFSYLQLVFAWVGLIVLQALMRFQSTYRTNIIGAQLLNNLSCRLYDHVQMLPLDYFSNRRKGEILSLISNDANILSYFLSGVLTGLVPATLLLIGATVLMAQISLWIAMVIVLTVPCFFLIMKVLGRNIRSLSEQVVKQQAGAMAIATENFGAIQLIKSFQREGQESIKFKRNADDILSLREKQLHIQALISPLMQMFISIGVVVIVVISALHYQSGALTIAQLVTLLLYGFLFAKPISTFAGLYGQLQQARGSATRIVDVFNILPESDDNGDRALDCKAGRIELTEVSFGYQPNKPLLRNLNACFEANRSTIILGDNGSGKTSLLHLLMRFTAPNSGEIRIDGQPIASCSLVSLRKHIGLVSQDIALCNGSIFDNIAYGAPNASQHEVVQAAKLAGASQFIEALDLGYQTQVGENGILLSGGQRQRISLARALLFDPKILLFDEPTSFADEAGRHEFSLLLTKHLQHKTVIIVTHDAELRSLAARVLVLKDGQLQASK